MNAEARDWLQIILLALIALLLLIPLVRRP
jgi:hypothetical protein